MGWLLGYIFGNEIEIIFSFIPGINKESFNDVEIAFNNHGDLIIFLGAFTPLPFKIISVTSGVFKVNILLFFIMSLIGRGLRFFIISFVVKTFGDKGIYLLKKHTFLISTLIGFLFIIFYVLLS